jgi:hydrogenase maturation protein HypF
VWLEINNIPEIDKDNRDNPDSINAIKTARNLLQRGKIVAIKGLGGFHLACDARNPEAVERLRSRKLRVDKPFAIMFPDVDTINKHCHIDDHERALLNSTERPIVVVQRKETSDICSAVAPKQNTLGVMLPYTPLHYLLFIKNNELLSDDHSTDDNLLSVLVMTSGNISEEPIAIENSEARSRLADIADAFLMHNRPIYIRCDDSVMRILEKPQDSVINYSLESVNHDDKSSDSTLSNNFQSDIYPLRRSRGYAPYPIYLPKPMPTILAVGAELKNTFCVTHDCYAFISQHIGDLENYETLVSFEKGITHYERLFQIRPELIAFDLHPNYLSTRYAADRAERESIPCIGIQHHHAHIAACMIENDIQEDELVIGVAFDGTGFGTDGKIWGGEFLLSNYSSFSRVAHLDYLPLPGGDTSIRKPARIALAYLWSVGIDWDPALDCVSSLCVEERQAIGSQLENKLNSPFTSSMGRLFDAVAALAGVRQRINYEAQAAIELEHIVAKNETSFYEFTIQNSSGNDNAMIINPKNVIHSIVNDVYNDVSSQLIAARFHNGVSQMVMKVCKEIQNRFNTNKIVLSGGVWQNTTLLLNTIHLLSKNGFLTYIHRQVPPNDGGISLGQAVIAAAQADGRIE